MSENIDVKIVLQAIDKASGDINKVKEISKTASAEIQMAMIKERIRLTELKQANSTLITTTQRLSLEKLKLREATLKATSASKDLKTSKSSLNESILSVKNAMIGLGVVMTGQLVKGLIDTQIKADNFERTLKVVAGSSQVAGMEIQFLKEQSNRLGLEFLSVSGAYAKFSASTKLAGMSMNDTRESFLGVAEAGASLGLSAYDMEGALNALSQMASKGTVSSEELKQQLGERIPGALGLAAKAMNMTNSQFLKMLESGQIMASDLLPKLGKEMRATFGGGAVDGAKSLNGQMNRFANSMFELKKAVLDTGLSTAIVGMFAKGAESIRDAVDSYNLWKKSLGDGEKATASNQKELSIHKQTVMELGEEYKKLKDRQKNAVVTGFGSTGNIGFGNDEIKTIEAYEKAIKNINAIEGKGSGELFASRSRDVQLKSLKATNGELSNQLKIEKEILESKKTESKPTVDSKSLEKQKEERLKIIQARIDEENSMNDFLEENNKKTDEIWKEDAKNKLALSYEISEMQLQAQEDSLEKEKQLAILKHKEQSEILLNEKANSSQYIEALTNQHNANLTAIEKKWNDKRTKDTIKNRADIVSTYINAMQLMVGQGKKYALLNKALAMGEIVVNTARAVTSVLPNIPMSIAMGVLGGAQLAKASQVKYAAKGADFVTNGPQLMMVGENSGGRERVQVTPLSSPNINGPKTSSSNVSFGNININVNNGGDLISMLEKNPDRFNQLLKNGLKRGAMSGVI